jgi:hypothetical protein
MCTISLSKKSSKEMAISFTHRSMSTFKAI